MTEQYTQTVEVTVSSKTKGMQWAGIVAVLLALGFLMLAIFLVWYFVFGMLALLAIGIVYIHFYNISAQEYAYDFSTVRLIVVKKDLMGKQKRILCLVYEDIIDFGIMEGLAEDEDIIACNAAHEAGVYQIVYRNADKTRRLLFAPDDYLLALLKQRIASCDNATDKELSAVNTEE